MCHALSCFHFVNLNPLVPARIKFARFRSVQKWTLFVFRPQFGSLPSKIFISENIFIGKIRFSFHWFHFKNLPTNRLAVTGWKLKADLTKKCFFLFFNLSEIKRLFSLCNKEIFNFWGKFFFSGFRASYWYSAGRPLITRVKRVSM